MNESSAQKDQSIRKYEQELEGLNFRNQQLTARVESLQRELENLAANSANTNPQASSISQNSSTSSLPNSLTTSSNYFSSPSSFSSTLSTTPLNSSTSLASSLKNDRASSRLEILSEGKKKIKIWVQTLAVNDRKWIEKNLNWCFKNFYFIFLLF